MRVSGVVLMMLQFLAAPLWGAGQIDWDAWVDGRVSVSLRNHPGGEGAVLSRASDGVLEFEATESAYHMVVAVDPQGELHLLFPRYWDDDGWVRRGSVQRLQPAEFATCGDPWSGSGIVHVEVIASPTPFAWERLGLRRLRSGCRWMTGGGVYRVTGDPYVAFDRLHRRLFPRWDEALFVVDETWFFIGSACDVPVWIRERRPVVIRHAVGWSGSVRVRVRWNWDFGVRCARPVYRTHVPVHRPRVHHVWSRPPVRHIAVRSRSRATRPGIDSRVEVEQRAVHESIVSRVGRRSTRVDDRGRTIRRITREDSDVPHTRRRHVERRRVR